MIPGVVSYLMTFLKHSLNSFRLNADLGPQDEERCFDIVLFENIQQAFRVKRWSVVESKGHARDFKAVFFAFDCLLGLGRERG